MIALIIVISIYVLSFSLMYLHTRLAHSDRGIWNHCQPSSFDMWMTILPLLNTLGCFIVWFTYYPIERGSRNRTVPSRFFMMKKEK